MSSPKANLRHAVILLAGLALLALGPATATADSPPPTNLTITIADTGFDPPTVFLAQGGIVTWTNVGSTAHHVETGSSPVQFEFGLSPQQTKSWAFPNAGTYHYTSGSDCFAVTTLFRCIDYSVVVLPRGELIPAAALAPAATPVPATAIVSSDVRINITDNGFSPPVAAVTSGGGVTWLNQSLNVHSARSVGAPYPPSFDSGGIGTGQSILMTFVTQGLYTYTSATDCLNNAQKPDFNCGPYSLLVTDAAPGTRVPIGGLPGGTPPGGSLVAPSGGPAIIVDDSGFRPSNLTIKLGQTVIWTSQGHNVHSVVSDPGAIPSFNSGGLAPSQTYVWLPAVARTYTYHSSTDPLNAIDPACNCFPFNGTVVVQP